MGPGSLGRQRGRLSRDGWRGCQCFCDWKRSGEVRGRQAGQESGGRKRKGEFGWLLFSL